MIPQIKVAIQSLVARLGYRIVRQPKRRTPGADRLPYESVSPEATYAPWASDDAFLSCYVQVKANTMVDMYRCWELWTLVEQSSKLRGCILEVGVWRGGTGALLAKKALLCGIRDPVYLCDTFRGVVKAGDGDSAYVGGEHADTSRSGVEALMQRLGLENVRILEGVFPNDTAASIEDPDGPIRLCHIDVDVYQSAKDVADWIWERLVVGGMVVYDDYGFEACDGVTRFVDELRLLDDRLVFHNLNGHAIVVKIQPRRILS
jgi:O-methyltransferase